MKLAWGNKVEPEFVLKVWEICAKFHWKADPMASWLMSCIAFESAETFDPGIRNFAGSSGTGLIQFMSATAKGLGTTTDDLAKMTAVEQLDYVRLYFKPYASRIVTFADMYMAILLPSKVGLPDDAVLFTKGSLAYKQNAGLDSNKDGTITKKEAASLAHAKLDRGLLPAFALDVDEETGIILGC